MFILSHERIGVVGRRDEVFLDRPGRDPSQQVLHRAGLVIGSASATTAKRLLAHARTGGTLLNMKFNPQVLEGAGLDKMTGLIRGYFRLDGHHVQFNVIDKETLLAAQQNPAGYKDLIVRVAGYSDYFIDLGADLQNEIIARTEMTEL